ncbi:helix-turn-helix domain-containing protein [Arthrobacter sp. UYCo732]|uniref:winged helix-turn-helix domain-containing protein n=1 Tax=Arthrobacter sp. UYCo732 TaxID=3156336 RepID=UPI003397DB25
MNRTRSRIIRFLLRNGPSTCGQIGSELHTTPSNVRWHLSLLRDAGLVQHASTQFSASPERVQRYASDLAASFHDSVMPPGCCGPMNQEHNLPLDRQLRRRTS